MRSKHLQAEPVLSIAITPPQQPARSPRRSFVGANRPARKRKTRKETLNQRKPNQGNEAECERGHPESQLPAAQQLVIRERFHPESGHPDAVRARKELKLKLPQRSRMQRNAKKENVMEWE